MNCYLCDNNGDATDAVAICQHCGVALCREHVDQDVLADRPTGLGRRGCTHNPVAVAHSRHDSVVDVEALW